MATTAMLPVAVALSAALEGVLLRNHRAHVPGPEQSDAPLDYTYPRVRRYVAMPY